jgi:hypothetical protein
MSTDKHVRFPGSPLACRDADAGHGLGWRHRVPYDEGRLDGEMTDRETRPQATALKSKG